MRKALLAAACLALFGAVSAVTLDKVTSDSFYFDYNGIDPSSSVCAPPSCACVRLCGSLHPVFARQCPAYNQRAWPVLLRATTSPPPRAQGKPGSPLERERLL